MPLSQERYEKLDNELQRASAYFERLYAGMDPGPDAGAQRAAWAKARAIAAHIENCAGCSPRKQPSNTSVAYSLGVVDEAIA